MGNSIFHLRPKNVFYNTGLSGNEGQYFLYEGRRLITFHMFLQCLSMLVKDTWQDKPANSPGLAGGHLVCNCFPCPHGTSLKFPGKL